MAISTSLLIRFPIKDKTVQSSLYWWWGRPLNLHHNYSVQVIVNIVLCYCHETPKDSWQLSIINPQRCQINSVKGTLNVTHVILYRAHCKDCRVLRLKRCYGIILVGRVHAKRLCIWVKSQVEWISKRDEIYSCLLQYLTARLSWKN